MLTTWIRHNKIECADCTWKDIVEAGRCLHTRKKEHIRNTKVFKSDSNIASLAWLEGHTIDFENARVIQEKRCNPGTLQLLAKQTIILSSCQDNTQFYCNLIHVISILLPHKYLFCITVFIYIRSLFSHLFVHIYFYLRFLHLTF